ncbi:E3 ubiquitin-protein ligase trul-1-like [Harmonia axyridis]|uniref:E3 ubiquitin-protein ligase trul-1-like n=1 Tax=Harmonia axyridis TaxID=115357 RepID=UPI001E2759C4|nr:E3 ubiquitin-protein ligase trul-1-like [Harmonia axyridis]
MGMDTSNLEKCIICGQEIDETDVFVGKCLHQVHKKCLSTEGANISRCPQCSEEIGTNLVEGDCTICLETLKNGIYITNCRHSFHRECISKWASQNETCPYCRSPVPKEDILGEYIIDSTSSENVADVPDEYWDDIGTYWAMFVTS